MSGCAHAGSFLEKRVGKQHELLIVGWKFTTSGEVWLAKPMHGGLAAEKTIHVAFGQFGVDDAVMAPESSFENEYWQEGLYDPCYCNAIPEWRRWTGRAMYMTGEELKALAISIHAGFHSAIQNKSRLVICDKKKIAHSRTC